VVEIDALGRLVPKDLVILRVLLKGCVFIGSEYCEIWDKDLYENQ
jgi:DNA-binding transcriptional regulator/RsmH inhibitor MraZ